MFCRDRRYCAFFCFKFDNESLFRVCVLGTKWMKGELIWLERTRDRCLIGITRMRKEPLGRRREGMKGRKREDSRLRVVDLNVSPRFFFPFPP